MFEIAGETVFRTGVLSALYIVASGWDTVKFYFSPQQIRNSSKTLVLAYMCHSAYFITADTDLDYLHGMFRVSEIS